MRRDTLPGWADLAAVIVLALLAAVVTLAAGSGWIDAVAGLGLVLVLPGYSIAVFLFPPRTIPRGERLVYVFALSVAASVLGGLLVQSIGHLDRPTWSVLLCAVTVAFAVAALMRRRDLPADPEPPRLALPRVNPLSVAAILAAVALSGWAIEIASRGAHRQAADSQFSALWILPDQGGGSATSVSIGVQNHEGGPTSYLVRMSRSGEQFRDWRIRLRDGERWRKRVPASEIPGEGSLLLTLYRHGQVYHRVYLRPAAPS